MLVSHPPSFVQLIYPSLIWKIKTDRNQLFLTFDDGPTPGVTDVVLDKLLKVNAKATFFCLGKNIDQYPELFKRIIDEGHSVGNHSYNHLNGWKSNTIEFLQDVNKFDTLFKSKLFRPPYGRLKSAQIKALKERYSIIMWSTLSMDYDPNISKEKCLELTCQNLEKGSIIVFHDSLKAKDKMLYALENLLHKVELEGWKCSAIPYN